MKEGRVVEGRKEARYLNGSSHVLFLIFFWALFAELRLLDFRDMLLGEHMRRGSVESETCPVGNSMPSMPWA
jgi:hypothetical protein